MRYFGSLIAVIAIVGSAGCQGGEVTGTVTTDYGVALATTEQTAPGDIDSWLTSRDGKVLLGSLAWDIATQHLSAQVAEIDVTSEAVDLSERSLEQFNHLLFQLWEIEMSTPATTTCLDDGQVICCRDSAWHCGASQITQ